SSISRPDKIEIPQVRKYPGVISCAGQAGRLSIGGTSPSGRVYRTLLPPFSGISPLIDALSKPETVRNAFNVCSAKRWRADMSGYRACGNVMKPTQRFSE